MKHKLLMENRSNRRLQTLTVPLCLEHDKAIRSKRANNPLWPEQLRSNQRPDIRVQSYPNPDVMKCLQNGRSPYTVSRQQTANFNAQHQRQSDIKNCLEKIERGSGSRLRLWWIANANPPYSFILDVGGQTALSFAHHLSIKAVGRKALPTLCWIFVGESEYPSWVVTAAHKSLKI